MARAKAVFGLNEELFAMLRGGERGLFREMVAEACAAGAELWFRQFLPRHFKADAAARYPGDYVPRTRAYQIRKAREKGHQNLMVWSGALQRTITSKFTLIQNRGRGQPRARVQLAHAAVLNLWAGGRRKHNFALSLTGFTTQELRTIHNTMREYVAARLPGRLAAARAAKVEKKYAA